MSGASFGEWLQDDKLENHLESHEHCADRHYGPDPVRRVCCRVGAEGRLVRRLEMERPDVHAPALDEQLERPLAHCVELDLTNDTCAIE
jgi:hypothetical protein